MNNVSMHFLTVLLVALLPVVSQGKFLRAKYDHGSLEKESVSSIATTKKVQRTKPMQNASDFKVPKMRVSSTAASKHVERQPRVYFLFLAVNKVANFGVWKAFFQDASPEMYRALIHCKGAACKLFAADAAPLELIPTVEGSYCTDLVTPMNQLLAVALHDDPGSANPADKFVFVSDSTLPAKPFWSIYKTLTDRPGSDFCMFPSKDWADVPAQLFENGQPVTGHEMAIKTSQWMVLGRSHSERAVHLWTEGVMKEMMSNFHVNTGGEWQAPGNRSLGDHHNFGCLDEYWHMYVLFGPWQVVDVKETTEFHYTDLTNAPILIKADAGWQGSCDTFALWSEYTTAPFDLPNAQNTSRISPWVKLYSSLDSASVPHVSGSSPAWWDSISRQGIQAIRNSDFLFVRKFKNKPTLAYGGDFGQEYSRIVLSI